jgi:hypothetical protein
MPSLCSPTLNARRHHLRDTIEPRVGLHAGTHRVLVGVDDLLDRFALACAVLQQLGCGAEREWHFAAGGDEVFRRGRAELLFGRNEAAAGGVISLLEQQEPAFAERAQFHAVRVQFRHDVIGENDVAFRIKRDLVRSQKLDALLNTHALHRRFSDIRIERFGIEAEQAQHHGFRRRVALAGQRQRSLQFHDDLGDRVQFHSALKVFQEAFANADRPERVRARGADADAEEVED